MPLSADQKPDRSGLRPHAEVAPPPGPAELIPAARPLPPLGGGLPGRNRRWLRLALALLLVIAAAAGGAWWKLLRPLPVNVVHPWRGEAIEAVYATGVVEAVDTARVGTTISGRIASLLVDEGDRVRRGEVLARLDDTEALQRVSDAKARLDLAEQELARDRALLARGVRAPQAVQRSTEERDRAAAAVGVAEKLLAEHTITSPLDGIVMTRPVEVGETVAAHAVLFTVASPARLRLAADVDERDIPRVRMGAQVAIRTDAFPQEAFTARITNIRGQADPATRTYHVEADLPPGTKLMMGMTVDVNIVVAERPDALLVPSSAIRHEPARGGLPGAAYVFRVEDGIARRTPVTLGAEGPGNTEIRAGVGPDAMLIAAAPEGLQDGARVRPRAAGRA